MKKVILLLLFSFCAITFRAQDPYSVYKVTGDIKIKTPAGWNQVQKRASLSAIDILQISGDGTIGILDNVSNRIFYSVKPGEQRVSQIVNAAKKQSDKITSIMNEQIKKSVGDNAANEYSYASVGASHRGSDSSRNTESIYASLCDAINHLPEIKSTASQIALQKMTTGEDEFFFVLENKYDFPLYVNVLNISASRETPIVCFNLGYSCDEPYMFIPPHKKIAVEHFVFAEQENSGMKYLLFGSPYPFDIQELQLLLNSRIKSTISKKDRLPVFLFLLD